MNFTDLEAHWLWLGFAALLAIAEILAPGVFLIWIAAAAALTGVVALATGVPLAFQLVLFALFSIASVYWGRRWYSNNPVDSSDPLLNDRAARLIGRSVTVVTAIENGEGRVRVGDSIWNCRGIDCPEGTRVRVTGAEGTCLTVAGDIAGAALPRPERNEG